MVTALEWKVKVGDGTSSSSSTVLEPKYIGGRLRDLLLLKKLWRFLKKAWNIGRRDPRKLMHCIKVGMALSLVSLFYYMRPLYDGVGGNAMWAVMTVVVVFEYTVGKYITHFFHSIPFHSNPSYIIYIYMYGGATLQKCVNRAIGTFLAGSLGVGVHWVASQSGKDAEPVILQVSVFLLGKERTYLFSFSSGF